MATEPSTLRQEFRLSGFVHPVGKGPCFVIPIFVTPNSNETWVQDVNNDDVVAGFFSCRTKEEVVLPKSSGQVLSVGSPVLFAFHFSQRETICGSRAVLERALKRRLREFDDRPFLRIEVFRFLHDEEGVEQAFHDASNLIKRVDPTKAKLWLQLCGNMGARHEVDPRSIRFSSSTIEQEFGTPLDPRFTFDNFVVSKTNEFAIAAARRVSEEARIPFNPLLLYGGVGEGKTHLMHAIGWEIRKRHPQRKLIYLSAEMFMYQFVRAQRFRDVMSFREHIRSADVLMIDDVQFIGGKDSLQEEFFHTINALIDQGGQIVLAADKSPADLKGIEDRVRSRLGWGLVADMHPTTYELRLGILYTKAVKMGLQVPSKVLEFLAHKITANTRELEGALNRIAAHATLTNRPLTFELVQDVLHDLLRANERHITIEEIQRRVAAHYAIKLSDMHSSRRTRMFVRPRQIAMYLSKELTSRSSQEIGKKFGGRAGSAVADAVRRVDELAMKDPAFAEDIKMLRDMLAR